MGFDAKHKIKFDQPKIFAYRASIPDLVKYTKQLLTDDKLCEEMGKRALAHALANYQYVDIAKKAVKIIGEKLGLK
jgi:hypothetical protein